MPTHASYPQAELLGRTGEEYAMSYLLRNGYAVLGRNVRFPGGEIDVVAQDGDGTIVFVEVKTRSSHLYGAPESHVSDRKLARIRAGAVFWLQRKAISNPVRFDVIALTKTARDGVLSIEHIKEVTDGAC